MRHVVLTLAVPALLSACASASKRVEQGQKLEREGRAADAAARYVQALKKDRTLEGARAGLRDAGARAIDEWVRQAAADDSGGRSDRAADAFLAADDLRGDASALGVDLALPPDYAARRRFTFDRAIAAALDDARALAQGEKYDDAARRVERAARLAPNGSQLARLSAGRTDALLAWAHADTVRGRFRAAYDRAARALDFEGLAAPDSQRAQAVQAAALARGTRRVAVVPPWARESARRALPDDALPALTESLVDKPWTEPPRFVDLAPLPLVQRELRRLDLSRRTLSSSDAARLGRALGADLVVIAQIDSARREETNLKATRRAAKTSGGADTAYTLEEGKRRLWVRIAYDVVEPTTRAVLSSETVTASASKDFKRGRYAGDPRTLDLRRQDRDLFDRGAADRVDRDLVTDLVDDLSPQLARSVFGALLRRIP